MNETNISSEVRQIFQPVFDKLEQLEAQMGVRLDVLPLQRALEEVEANSVLEDALEPMPDDSPAWVALREEFARVYNSIQGPLVECKVTLTRYERVIKAEFVPLTSPQPDPGQPKIGGYLKIEAETVGSTYVDGEWVPFGTGNN